MKISVFSLWANMVLETDYINPCGNVQNSEVLSSKEMTVDIAFLSPDYSKKPVLLWMNCVKGKLNMNIKAKASSL